MGGERVSLVVETWAGGKKTTVHLVGSVPESFAPVTTGSNNRIIACERREDLPYKLQRSMALLDLSYERGGSISGGFIANRYGDPAYYIYDLTEEEVHACIREWSSGGGYEG